MRRSAIVLAATMLVAALVVPPSASASAGYCQGLWEFSSAVPLPSGAWSVGDHQYAIRVVDTNPDPALATEFTVGPIPLVVSTAAPLYAGSVALFVFPISVDGWLFDGTINPAQPTFLFFSLAYPATYFSERQVATDREYTTISFSTDGGPWVAGLLSPVQSDCTQIGGPSFFVRSWGRG